MTIPIPDPGIYAEKSTRARQAYQTAMQRIAQNRSRLMQNYGMNAGGLDPFNQHGMIQEAKQAQGLGLENAADNASERGLGHSGLGQQESEQLRYQYAGDDQRMGQDYTRGIADFANQETDADTDQKNALWDARKEELDWALAHQPPGPPVTGDLPDEPVGTPGLHMPPIPNLTLPHNIPGLFPLPHPAPGLPRTALARRLAKRGIRR